MSDGASSVIEPSSDDEDAELDDSEAGAKIFEYLRDPEHFDAATISEWKDPESAAGMPGDADARERGEV
jgi:hypothetical protein